MTKALVAKRPRTASGRSSLQEKEALDAPARLLEWFQSAKRDLPWRGVQDPYAIWVSEVMLQQTRVEVVKRYYAAWMRRFPDLRALATAKTDDVLRVWQGLGYYSRARRLQEGAVYVLREHGGELPSGQADLLGVPGVGAYSAGAIGSIAFGQRVPAIDGNVVRVICRYYALGGDPTKVPLRKTIGERVSAWLPESAVGDFNQALMELGATVCSPRSPLCHSCPISSGCRAFSEGRTAELPTPKPRSRPVQVRAIPVLLSDRGRILVVRLGADARWWAGLSALPTLELGAGSGGALDPLSLGLKLPIVADPGALEVSIRSALQRLGIASCHVRLMESVSHTVTRHRLELIPAVIQAKSGSVRGPWERRGEGASLVWLRSSELTREPLGAPFRKIAEAYFDKRCSAGLRQG